jgi:sterol desaturase/sphingolipid hydroxylase (fatty acid hydroxylase superfamily)
MISFILLDLTVYLWHWANHKFSFLWMFHKVHHSDNSLNVSTAIRFHMGELFLTVVVKSAFIVVIGIEAEVVLASELVITLFEVFHHANISFKGEKLLSTMIIVPCLHRTHHSARRVEENSNYGIVFSVWDRAFGTIKEVVPERVGLRNVRDQNFLELLKFGFITK